MNHSLACVVPAIKHPTPPPTYIIVVLFLCVMFVCRPAPLSNRGFPAQLIRPSPPHPILSPCFQAVHETEDLPVVSENGKVDEPCVESPQGAPANPASPSASPPCSQSMTSAATPDTEAVSSNLRTVSLEKTVSFSPSLSIFLNTNLDKYFSRGYFSFNVFMVAQS